MRVDDFDFPLPAERIARFPAERRDASRLFVLHRAREQPGELVSRTHRLVSELPELLNKGDLLVLNDTRVIPARVRGHKPSGGRVELLLCEPESDDGQRQLWRALYGASKPVRPGVTLVFRGGLTAELVESLGEGMGRFALHAAQGVRAALEVAGELPLPPYLGRAPDESDRERYQTIYARHEGAVAAPTAGLHFTPALFEALAARGVSTATVTLHVGPGTFLPVRVQEVAEHRMHHESYVVPPDTVSRIAATRAAGGRIVAVGTTSLRTLEAAAAVAQQSGAVPGTVAEGPGRTDIFITPGYRFCVVDALLTNFHLPRSTLVMLVAALTGRGALLEAYAEAVREGYRFYSYGDAMLIL